MKVGPGPDWIRHYEVAQCMYAAGLWPVMLSPDMYGIVKQALKSPPAWEKLWSGDTEGSTAGEPQALALTVRRCVYQSIDVRTGMVALDGYNTPLDSYAPTEARAVAHMQLDTAAMRGRGVGPEDDTEVGGGAIRPNPVLEELTFALRDLEELDAAQSKLEGDCTEEAQWHAVFRDYLDRLDHVHLVQRADIDTCRERIDNGHFQCLDDALSFLEERAVSPNDRLLLLHIRENASQRVLGDGSNAAHEADVWMQRSNERMRCLLKETIKADRRVLNIDAGEGDGGSRPGPPLPSIAPSWGRRRWRSTVDAPPVEDSTRNGPLPQNIEHLRHVMERTYGVRGKARTKEKGKGDESSSMGTPVEKSREDNEDFACPASTMTNHNQPLNPHATRNAARKAVAALLGHAGFRSCSILAVETFVDVLAAHCGRIGAHIRWKRDSPDAEETLLETITASFKDLGHPGGVQDIGFYWNNQVERFGRELEHLVATVDANERAEAEVNGQAVERDAVPNENKYDEGEGFADNVDMPDNDIAMLTGNLGIDIAGFDVLGLAALGFPKLKVPDHLLRGNGDANPRTDIRFDRAYRRVVKEQNAATHSDVLVRLSLPPLMPIRSTDGLLDILKPVFQQKLDKDGGTVVEDPDSSERFVLLKPRL